MGGILDKLGLNLAARNQNPQITVPYTRWGLISLCKNKGRKWAVQNVY